jgi:hypothetical protein
MRVGALALDAATLGIILTGLRMLIVLVMVGFTIIAGVIQGRSSGHYPTVGEWTEALRKLLSGTGLMGLAEGVRSRSTTRRRATPPAKPTDGTT